MKSLVQTIRQLDSPYGYYVGRCIVLLMDESTFINNFNRIINDKEIKGTYTIVREVLKS